MAAVHICRLAAVGKTVLLIMFCLLKVNYVRSVPSNGDVRLRGRSNSTEGRVEVFYNGAWGTVCDDSWDYDDARVVCRQLGYGSGSHAAFSSASFGQGSGQILLDDVACTGFEERIQNCPSNGWYNHNCAHSEDAGVRCVLSDGDVRLRGGSNATEGRVEIFYNGAWETVCDDGWDDDGARVVCRQLGYESGSSTAVLDAYFGEGSGRIFLDGVRCFGWEDNLLNCFSNGRYYYDCNHSEDAGVKCVAYSAVRLVNGPAPNEGRVEVYYRGEWGTICDDSWGTADARVVCRQLGYPTDIALAFSSAYFGEGSGAILWDDVECYGWEDSLASCHSSGWNNHNCGHDEDAGVRCGGEPTVTGPSFKVILIVSCVGFVVLVLIVIGIVAVCQAISRKKRRSVGATRCQTVPTDVYQPPALVGGQHGCAGFENPSFLAYPPNALATSNPPAYSQLQFASDSAPVTPTTLSQPSAATGGDLANAVPPPYQELDADLPSYQELQSANAPVTPITLPQPTTATGGGLATVDPPAYQELQSANAPVIPTILPQPTAATGSDLATADPPLYQELQSPFTAQSGQESSYQGAESTTMTQVQL